MKRTSFIWYWQWALYLLIPAMVMVGASSIKAQRIVRLRPDRAAPGMNVIVEVITRVASDALLGNPGLSPSLTRVYTQNPFDTNRIVIGPVQVSWRSHLMQIPIFVASDADTGVIPIVIATNAASDTVLFTVARPDHIPAASGAFVLGEGGNGTLSAGNTLLIDSLKATNATITVSMADPDQNTPGNPRLEPVMILSTGPIILSNSTFSLNASGKNGGPGGGGGGGGFEGIGGVGFTGGGSCSDTVLPSLNIGSDSDATPVSGGRSITGVLGGGTSPSDQGGGGGTGAPFGYNFNAFKASGQAGVGGGEPRIGGYGGGSAGGEFVSLPILEFGGGGGGFGTPGGGGMEVAGAGQNGGSAYGGRFLIPLSGGSGGGAGNAYFNNQQPPPSGGSGGGGGGAIAMVSFDSITLINSSFTASGDSGTSGQVYGAGGGGGSGGAIWLSGARGIGGGTSTLSTSGGAAGIGSANAFAGGAGGDGRIRIDGLIGPSVLSQKVEHSSGVSITPIRQVIRGNLGVVSGLAPDTNNTLDTVRIYYRNHHTGWQYVDTVRTKGRWTKWIPLGRDSLLYLMAIVQTHPLPTDEANLEPDWIMSHIGLTQVHHVPTPAFVADTSLDFGKVRLGYCLKRSLRIYNAGQAPLVLDSVSTLGAAGFFVLGGKKTIPGYSTDSIEVEFCPDTLGPKGDFLMVRSNDSEHLTRQIALSGVGIHRADSLRFVPKVLHFGRVSVDSCKRDTVVLYSLGADTLSLNFAKWIRPPFSAELIPADSLLPPRDTARLIITFCPADTATVRDVVELDSRGDSLPIDGNGKLRKFLVQDTLDLGTFCASTPIRFSELIRSTGNDLVTLTSIVSSASGITRVSAVPFILNLNQDDTVSWWIPAPASGVHQDTLFYRSVDSVLRTIVTYTVGRPQLTIDSATELPFLCVSETDTFSVRLRNPTVDTLSIKSSQLDPSPSFTVVTSISTIAPRDSVEVRVAFHPLAAGPSRDTLRIIIAAFGCDSNYQIPIARTGTVDGLAVDSAEFGVLDLGDCKDDSIRIQNTCGPVETVDTVLGLTPGFQCLSAFPITIPSKGSAQLHFRYCPAKAGNGIDTIQILQRSGGRFQSLLRGTGRSLVVPSAYFTVSSPELIRPGDTARTDIWLDSATLTGIHTLYSTKVSFDPSVVLPLSVSPGQFTRIMTDSIVSGAIQLDFSKRAQFVQSISWLALIGPSLFSPIRISLLPDTLVELHIRQGSISVQDCSGLNGQISVAGPYRLGQVVPDAAPGKGEVEIELGNDGYVEASIFDLTGRLSRTALSEFKRGGRYILPLPLSGVSSGRYFLVVSSNGWRAVRPFSIGW